MPRSRASKKTKSKKQKASTKTSGPSFQLQEEQVTQAAKALAAVLEYKRREEAKSGEARALFDEDEDIFLQFALHTTPAVAKNKPYQIPLVHTLFGQDGQEICVITTDPGKDVKAHLEAHPVEEVTKVLPFMNLKRNYNTYKLKRDLLNSYDLFLADDRIIPLLPPVLGKSFFNRKKQPVPVVLKGANFHKQIAKARDSTYFFLTHGASCSVRVARASFAVEETVANIMGAIEPIVKRIPKGWKNVQGIYLKSSKSAALPIYTALPEQTHTLTDSSAASERKLKKRKGPVAPPSDDAGIDDIMAYLSAPKQKKRKTESDEDAAEADEPAAPQPTSTGSKAAARKAALLAKKAKKTTGKAGKKAAGKKAAGKKRKR